MFYQKYITVQSIFPRVFWEKTLNAVQLRKAPTDLNLVHLKYYLTVYTPDTDAKQRAVGNRETERRVQA